MSDPLYRKELLRLAADAHGAGRLTGANATATVRNPACGDSVRVDLFIAEGRIAELAQETRACVLTQASASILGQSLKGASRDDVKNLRQTIDRMLESGGSAPASPFDAYATFDAAIAFPGRHCCVLLPLDAVLEAFGESDPPEPEAVRPKP